MTYEYDMIYDIICEYETIYDMIVETFEIYTNCNNPADSWGVKVCIHLECLTVFVGVRWCEQGKHRQTLRKNTNLNSPVDPERAKSSFGVFDSVRKCRYVLISVRGGVSLCSTTYSLVN